MTKKNAYDFPQPSLPSLAAPWPTAGFSKKSPRLDFLKSSNKIIKEPNGNIFAHDFRNPACPAWQLPGQPLLGYPLWTSSSCPPGSSKDLTMGRHQGWQLGSPAVWQLGCWTGSWPGNRWQLGWQLGRQLAWQLGCQLARQLAWQLAWQLSWRSLTSRRIFEKIPPGRFVEIQQ